ncbi:hypothetical protein PanWU01x14_095410, partial [Parasponia andersonii]
ATLRIFRLYKLLENKEDADTLAPIQELGEAFAVNGRDDGHDQTGKGVIDGMILI